MTSLLDVKIIPRSRTNAIAGYDNHVLKIKIKALPEKGKANKELIRFLSKMLHIPKSSIKIKSGMASRQKTIEIQNLSPKELDNRLQDLLN